MRTRWLEANIFDRHTSRCGRGLTDSRAVGGRAESEIHLHNPHQNVIETNIVTLMSSHFVDGHTIAVTLVRSFGCVCISHYNPLHNLIVGYVRILTWQMENPTGGQVDKVAHLE